MKIKELDKCKYCDHLCENKQRGLVCLNIASDNFNQKVELNDSCEHIETNYYAPPRNNDEASLFQ